MSAKTLSVERGSLTERRRRRRRRIALLYAIILFVFLGVLVWGLWQSPLRISHVQVFGSDAPISAYATEAMQGTYMGIIPRDSIIFFPERRIRADLLTEHPEIAAISIFRSGLTSISIKVDNRIPVARWCGSTHDAVIQSSVSLDAESDVATSSPITEAPIIPECYFFDVNGFIYAPSVGSTSPMNPFIVYEAIASEGKATDTAAPLGSTLPNSDKFPSAFDFARQLRTFGVSASDQDLSVAEIVIRDDEIDDYLTSGTRVTYLLGDEQNAFTALVSARDNFNLADGSVEYVDLRFSGKVYVKKKTE